MFKCMEFSLASYLFRLEYFSTARREIHRRKDRCIDRVKVKVLIHDLTMNKPVGWQLVDI